MPKATEAQKHVLFLPDWSKGNPYQKNLANALAGHGYRVRFSDYPDGAFPLLKTVLGNPDCHILHLHWVNSMVEPVTWSSSKLKKRIKLLMLGLDILLVKLRKVRIVWTIHNLVTHESTNQKAEIEARRVIALTASHLLMHSDSALKLVELTYSLSLRRKTTIAPHGNYDGCYPESSMIRSSLSAALNIEDRHTVVLFFGAIRRYKGLETLLNSFTSTTNPSLRLIIAGSCSDPELIELITKSANGDSRILPLLKFIRDDEVQPLFDLADVIALPFERTLTSGSATLACTMGRPLLVPEEAKVLDIVNASNSLFFDTEATLTTRLQTLDKASLREQGKSARAAVEHYSWKNVSELVAAAYAN